MSITSARMLALLRRKIADTDVTASYTDGELWDYVEDARALLSAKQIRGMTGFSVVTDPESASFGISPSPLEDEDAFILVLQTVHDILSQRYTDLVEAGALGISWRSGLEEESSISAEKAFKGKLNDIRRELDQLILIKNRGISATRPL